MPKIANTAVINAQFQSWDYLLPHSYDSMGMIHVSFFHSQNNEKPWSLFTFLFFFSTQLCVAQRKLCCNKQSIFSSCVTCDFAVIVGLKEELHKSCLKKSHFNFQVLCLLPGFLLPFQNYPIFTHSVTKRSVRLFFVLQHEFSCLSWLSFT